MTDTIRWGIISTGDIASKFATGLKHVENAELVAVGSRSQEKADAFAARFQARRGHASYEALAADSEVDAVYIGTPHVFHKDNTLLCLENGKHVLCEKPFAMTAAESREMIDTAREKNLFLMEAMWTRFLPLFVRLRQMLADGTIGEIGLIAADFGFRADFDPEHRLFNPALGGGALLDVGIYPVSLVSMLYGQQPATIKSLARIGETGVDEVAAMLFGYDNGRMAQLTTATRIDTPQATVINGTEGRIRIHPPWFVADTLTLSKPGAGDVVIKEPIVGNGYNYEAEELGRCVREGRMESDIMPLDETLAIMQTLDRILAQWHVENKV